jgi:hypothetical protein
VQVEEAVMDHEAKDEAVEGEQFMTVSCRSMPNKILFCKMYICCFCKMYICVKVRGIKTAENNSVHIQVESPIKSRGTSSWWFMLVLLPCLEHVQQYTGVILSSPWISVYCGFIPLKSQQEWYAMPKMQAIWDSSPDLHYSC